MNSQKNSDKKVLLKGAQILSSDSEFATEQHSINHEQADSELLVNQPIEPELSPNVDMVMQPHKKPKEKKVNKFSKKWFLALCVAVVLASTAELVIFTMGIFQSNDWLAGLWLLILAGAVYGSGRLIWQEWRGLKRLKIQLRDRTVTEQMFYSQAIGLAEKHCMQIASKLPIQHQTQVISWQEKLEDHLTDNEVLALFEQQVLVPIDKLAIKTIVNNASAAGVMIAVSPFALLDMFIVLWRNVKMINQVSEIYGIEVGYWGRVKLIKNIFHTMVYAGAAEILSDAGNYALGAGITGKLSTRIAQGLGASVLTTRIGLKAIEASRPMPCLTVKKPNLTVLTKQLFEELNSKIN